VIAFPKSIGGNELMVDSPSNVSPSILKDYHIQILENKEGNWNHFYYEGFKFTIESFKNFISSWKVFELLIFVTSISFDREWIFPIISKIYIFCLFVCLFVWELKFRVDIKKIRILVELFVDADKHLDKLNLSLNPERRKKKKHQLTILKNNNIENWIYLLVY